MTIVYRIADFDSFLNAEAKKVRGKLSWFKAPAREEDRWFGRLMELADGLAIYGTYMLLVGVAVRERQDGLLADALGPFSADDLAHTLRVPRPPIDRALEVLCAPELRRIEIDEWKAHPRVLDYQSIGTRLPIERQSSVQSSMLVRVPPIEEREERTDRKDMSVRDVRDEYDQTSLGQATDVLGKLTAVLAPRTDEDWLIVEQVALAVATGVISEDLAISARDAVKHGRHVERPFGLFIDVLQKGCTAKFIPFAFITTIRVPRGWNQRRTA